jgi:hypothetical protein
MDEACWTLFETPRKVVEEASDTVELQSKNGEDTSFTALGVISSAEEKSNETIPRQNQLQ